MALPTITNNSPSAGYISWTAFGISYGGSTFSVPAGNSNKKYIWWQYNGGAPVLMNADTLPTLLDADILLFLNKGGIGALVPTLDVVDGSLLVSGSVLADAIGVNQINAVHMNANAVTANSVAANAITSLSIAAGAITTNKLSVGSVGDNLQVNGSFEDGTEGYTVRASGTGGVADVVTGVSSAGSQALRLTRGTVANLQVSTDDRFLIPVTAVAGHKWYIAGRAGAGSTLASGFYIRAYFFQANKTTAASTPYVDVATNTGLNTSWTLFEGQVTPPADARYMRLDVINALSGSVMYVDELVAREVIVSAQIGDGQITTPKLVANAVTADKIQGNAIDGKVITGAIVRTGSANPRVELDSYGFHGYAANAAEVTSVGTDGKFRAIDAQISGIYRTAASGPRIEITPPTSQLTGTQAGVFNFKFQDDTVGPNVLNPNQGGTSYQSLMVAYKDVPSQKSYASFAGPSYSITTSYDPVTGGGSGVSASTGQLDFGHTWTGAGTNVTDYANAYATLTTYGKLTLYGNDTVSLNSGGYTTTVIGADLALTGRTGAVNVSAGTNVAITSGTGTGAIRLNGNTVVTGTATVSGTLTASVISAPSTLLDIRSTGTANVNATTALNLNTPVIRMNSRVFGIPSYTTTQRATYFPSPLEGDRYYDTTLQADMIYYSTGQVAVAGWYPVAGRIPSMVRNRNTSGTLAPSTFTAVQLPNLEGLATAGMTYNATTGEITVAQRGLYSILSSITIPMSGGYRVINQLSVNGVTSMYETATVSVNGTVTLQNAQQIVLPANSVVKLSARMDEPTNRDLTNARLGITYLGPA